MKKIASILMLLFVVSACDETVDPTIYGGTESDRTFLSFSRNVYDLPVVLDDTGSVTLTLNSSTSYSTDRVYSISVVESETTADPSMYTLPSTVTIPAGEHQGMFVIQGFDNGVEVAPVNLVIEFEPLNAPVEDFDSSVAVVSIFEVCPIPPGLFTGAYLIQQITGNGPYGPAFTSQVVTLVSETEYTRSFRANYLPSAVSGNEIEIRFTLSCYNNVITASGINGRVFCNEEAGNITLGPGGTPGAYDVNDDSSFTVTITEFVSDGGCDVGPHEVTFQFTKQ